MPRSPATRTASSSASAHLLRLRVLAAGSASICSSQRRLDRPPGAAQAAHGDVRAPAEALAALLRQQRGRARHVARPERRHLDAGAALVRLPDDLRRHRRHRRRRLPRVQPQPASWRSSPSASCRCSSASSVVWQIYARRAFMRVRQAIAIVNSNLQENVSGVRVIQSLSREDVNAQRFSALNADNMRANIAAGRLQAAIMPMRRARSPRSRPRWSLVYGGRQVLNGDLSLGAFVLFVFSIERFFQPIRELVMQYTQLQRAMAGGVRVFEVLDTEPEIVDAAGRRRARRHQGRGRVRPRRLRLRRGRAGAARHQPAKSSPARPSRSWARPAPARRRSRR